MKADNKPSQPLSANTLTWSKPETKVVAKQPTSEPHRRYGSRSQSLSMANEQAQNNMPNVVNGAISVEELESPVLGMPAHRTRYHSVNESNSPTSNASRIPAAENKAPFHKLLSKVDNFSIKDAVDSARPSSTHISTRGSTALQVSSSASNFSSVDGNKLKNNLQRSISTPGGCEVQQNKRMTPQIIPKSTNPPFTQQNTNSSFNSLISAFPNTMPTLHEHISPRTSLMKSISLSSGMSQLSSSTPKNSASQVVATLHGNSSKEPAKLLSPDALQLTEISTSNTVSTLASGT